MNTNKWNAGEAAVAADTKVATIAAPLTIGQRFEELREILRSENYQMPRMPKRRNRRNDFARML